MWHQRLGHISKERMRLVKSEIPPQLEFSDLYVCIDCIKGKQTKHTVTKPATRSTQFLRLIHTNISGHFDAPSWSGEKDLIIFIDDYSQYVYTYLLHERSNFVDVLKVFTDKMERRLDRKVKVVRSDRGGELYGKLLQSRGICAQYSMSNNL